MAVASCQAAALCQAAMHVPTPPGLVGLDLGLVKLDLVLVELGSGLFPLPPT